MLGGAKDAQSFIDRIEETLKPENSWAHHEAKYAADPKGYALTYINALNSAYMNTKGDEIFEELFEKRTVEENFDAESIEYYKKSVNTLDNKVFVYMLENEKAVSKIMGKEEYSNFIANVVNNTLASAISRTKTADKFTEKTQAIADNKKLHTTVYKFFIANLDNFYSNNGKELMAATMKVYKKLSADELDMIIPSVVSKSMVKRELPEELKEDARTLLMYAQDKTVNSRQKQTYAYFIKATE